MRRTLAILWAAPYSLFGLLLAPFFSSHRSRHGVLLCEGAAWPRRLGWRYRAITFGHVVLAIDRLDPATLAHELIHVRQYEMWGPLMVPAYLLASAWALVRGRAPYTDNAFEVVARRDGPPLALALAEDKATGGA
ncbi:MAG: signal peptide prediction [Actinomycetota bacterium]